MTRTKENEERRKTSLCVRMAKKRRKKVKLGGVGYRVGQNAPIHCIPLGTLGLTGAASLVQTHKDLLLPRGGGRLDEWTGEGGAAGAPLCSATKKTRGPLPLTAHQTHRHTHLGNKEHVYTCRHTQN